MPDQSLTVAPSSAQVSFQISKGMKRLALAFLPFTPVPFTGPDAIYAWTRLGAYGLLSYWSWSRMRPLSYISMGAAGVSLATSLTAGIWAKQ